MLTKRLHELADAQVAVHTGDGCVLTDTGRALVVSLRPILRWADDRAREVEAAGRAAEQRAG